MNLHNRRLYRLPIGIPAAAPSASVSSAYDPPDIGTGPTGCVLHPQTPAGGLNLNLRPFAVKVIGGSVYVGWVCTAESSQLRQDLRAFVYKLDVATGGYTQIANFSLNYPRGCASGYDICNSAVWNPWSPTQRGNLFYQFQEYDYAQPMLSDIEFDDAGNMIVALGDRFGHQTSEERKELNGPLSIEGAPAGDILKLFPTNSAGTNYQLENNARLGSGAPTLGQDNGQGPGGGEFYYRDTFPIFIFNFGLHQELATGGLAVLPGSNEVVLSAYNPTPLYEDVDGVSTFRTVGPLWFDNTTGTRTRSHMLIQYIEPGYFTKATGMGDVELMCDSAPIEIGNRVWLDVNGNGIQDPDEQAAQGITVRLYPISGTQVLATPIATTTTDAQGRYHFSSAGPDNVQFNADDLGNYGPDTLANTADDLALPGLKPSTSRILNRYAIRLDNPANYFTGEVLDNLAPTAPDVNSGPNFDERDSDAVLVNGFPQITFVTGHSGQNNYALDFGLAQPARMTGRVWVDDDHNGVRVSGGPFVTGTQVTAIGPGSFVSTTITDDTGRYIFDKVPPGTYSVIFAVPQGYTLTFPLVGDPAFDSDVINLNGSTYTFTLNPTEDRPFIDMGLWKPGAVIDLQALTNGADANTITGPLVPYNTTITWTYRITNTGEITLSRIYLQDDQQGPIDCPVFELAPGQGAVCQKTGLSIAGQYTNVASVSATDFVSVNLITDSDPSHHFGVITPTVEIKKLTNGQSAEAAPGPSLIAGQPVTWSYIVTNTGNMPFSSISIIDDREGPIACPFFNLTVGQSVICLRTGTVISGPYENRATVTASYNVPNVRGTTTANAISHYTGYPGASVGGLVWIDRNLNGHYEPNELPLFGVTATLLSLSGNVTTPVAVLRSNGDGGYVFRNLLPGTYRVLFTPLAGYRFTTPFQGDVKRNSDADPATGLTLPFAVAAGEVNDSIGAGFFTELPRISVRVTINGLDSDIAPGSLFEVGTPLEWTYIIQNTGEITLTQIRVGDDKAGPLANCNRETLAPGQLLTCNRLGTTALGTFSNMVTVSGTIPGTEVSEAGPASPDAVVTTSATSYHVGGLANLAVQKDSVPLSNTFLVTGNLVTYSLNVINAGNYTATGVVVSDVLPVGLHFVSGSSGISVITGTSVVTVSWDVGTLGLAQNRVVTVSAKAFGTAVSGTIFSNVAYAASSQNSQRLSNSVRHTYKVTAVTLVSFSTTAQANGVLVEWRTGAELNTFGFALYRSANTDRAQALPISEMISAGGAGFSYRYLDASGHAGDYYWLVETDRNGLATEYGPMRVQAEGVLPASNAIDANVIAGGVPVAVPASQPDALTVAQPASSSAVLPSVPEQKAVGVQVSSVNIEAPPAVAVPVVPQATPQRAAPIIESAPVAKPPEQAAVSVDVPQQAQPTALPVAPKVDQPIVEQPAQGTDAVATAVAAQPTPAIRATSAQAKAPAPTQPPSTTNWWLVLAGALVVLVVFAGCIVGLLYHQLRRG
jgi:uncharacterized repeat protein (TIGR01451 family)